MIPARISFVCILVLLLFRAVLAAQLPLSADEAYYWLWSKHLALGYFDHPPAIAWLIHAGTTVFGDTPLGVRFWGLVLSLPASWFVWRGGELILRGEVGGQANRTPSTDRCEGRTGDRAALAVLFFNLTLMVSVELLAATPDMPLLVASAGFVYSLARVRVRDDAQSWLGAGLAAGLGLLAKFSMLFLGAGALLWLILDRDARKSLRTPWPYLGACLAAAVFAPNLWWQSQHHWQTVAFQFARVGAGHFAPQFLLEFLAAQLGLATPLIFVLMGCGLWRATRLFAGRLFVSGEPDQHSDSDRPMLICLVWVGLGYFLEHSLHDRVQGNWPCFLYPALCILAADAFTPAGGLRKVSLFAAPLAAALLLGGYVQALFQPLPLKNDPLARLLGRDFAPIGEVAAAMVKAHLAEAVVTTDYQTTAWLRFNQPGIKVIQVNDSERFAEAPAADAPLLRRSLIYLTEFRRDQHLLVQKFFAYTGFPTQLQRPSSLYMVYPVGRPKTAPLGKMP